MSEERRAHVRPIHTDADHDADRDPVLARIEAFWNAQLGAPNTGRACCRRC
jgi:hypothetical protein